MDKDQHTRKLAVILHADVIGSTSLVQQNESLAHARIHGVFEKLSGVVESYGGATRELRGDALLAEFDRAFDAVTAALAFQAANVAANAAIDDQIKPRWRIGISLGEVIVADATITGAGVVLAQRVEQLCDPDSVCITAALHEALPRRMPFDLSSLGEQALKGFDEPVTVYRTQLRPGHPIPSPEQSKDAVPASTGNRRWLGALVAAIAAFALILWLQPWTPGTVERADGATSLSADKPSIAVLPFENMSDDPDQAYFSDGISEDLITDLSQLKNLAVIARNSSFTYRDRSVKAQLIGQDLGARYLLEGSVRKAGNHIRITAQLIDAASGHHLWAERFDRELTEMFAVQDEITERIVSALSIQLSGDERQQLAKHATNNFEAYDLFLQGQIVGARFSREGLAEAALTYRRVIDLDPGFARAYGALAVVKTRQVIYEYTDTPQQTMERALDLARKATSMDPASPHTQWALGYVHLYMEEHEKAIEALERAVTLSPSYADGYAMLALINNHLGRAEQAIRLIEKGIELNPYYSWDYLYNLGRAHYALGEYQKAIAYLQQALERNEAPRAPRLFLIASLIQADRQDDAEWELMQLETTYPDVSLSQLRAVMAIADAELMQKLTDDVRLAGMAE